MEDFKKILLRLKNELGVETDNQVAEFLGLTPAAFRTRKNRNTFPVHQLTVFALSHPELKLDLDYILGNQPKQEDKGIEIIVNPNAIEELDEDMDIDNLSPRETLLIKYFRHSRENGKETILRIAKMEAVLSSHDL